MRKILITGGRVLIACFISETTEQNSIKFSTVGLHSKLANGFNFGSYRSNITLTIYETQFETLVDTMNI
jgi:hypothetical protein